MVNPCVRRVLSGWICAVTAVPILGCNADIEPAVETPMLAEIAVSAAGPGETCLTVAAGEGFASVPIPDVVGFASVTFTAQPSGPNIDVVFGLSAGPAKRFRDIAAAIRFAPAGIVDVRDGDGYRADAVSTYGTAAKRLRLLSDLSSHTYSVFEDLPLQPSGDVAQLARQYQFRLEQAAVNHLDHMNAIVDSKDGSASICFRIEVPADVAYIREGRFPLATYANDDALIADGRDVLKLDPAGRVLASVRRFGQLATDPLGNAYVAQVSASRLALEQFDAQLALRWLTVAEIPGLSRIHAFIADAAGIAVAVGNDRPFRVLRFAPNGAQLATIAVVGTRVGLASDHAVTATAGAALRLTKYDVTGAEIWTRSFPGNATINTLTVSPDHTILLGGELLTATDFGGGELPVIRTDNGPINGYVAMFSAAGDHVYSRRTNYTVVNSIATNGTRVAVAGTHRTQFTFRQLRVFDFAAPPSSWSADLSHSGLGVNVAMSPSGRIWSAFDDQFQLFSAFPFLYALRAP